MLTVSEDEVAYYRVNYGTSPGAVIATRTRNNFV